MYDILVSSHSHRARCKSATAARSSRTGTGKCTHNVQWPSEVGRRSVLCPGRSVRRNLHTSGTQLPPRHVAQPGRNKLLCLRVLSEFCSNRVIDISLSRPRRRLRRTDWPLRDSIGIWAVCSLRRGASSLAFVTGDRREYHRTFRSRVLLLLHSGRLTDEAAASSMVREGMPAEF